ncbi:hypothetical protein LSUE1_G002962 [Lachnellula suecica]|uniref:Uncharacterized protein n=1 Tax=Lachnellula suecica TaxID=602035 RepID=A0A8T9CFM5_9HELO|nr:hypothetical protein LSUE1_G002962 [Lachnellula suecica]
MGSCASRLKAEMVSPHSHTQRSGSGDMLGPRRPEPYISKTQSQSQGNGAPLRRKETESGIPGLTYDHAGRPVWREENATRADGVEVEHRERMS